MKAVAEPTPDATSIPVNAARPPAPVRRLLFAFCVLLYTLTSAGRFNSTDGHDVYNTAQSLLLRHSLAIPPDIGTFIGRGGATYAKYGIGQSLAEIPLSLLDLLAQALRLFISAPQLFASMTNAWITAAAVVVLYQLARDLAYSPRAALTTALVYALTTPAWPYAKLDFSEPLLALLLLLAALGAHRFTSTRRLRWIALVGAALGYAILTKYAAVIFAPLFAVYLVYAWRLDGRAPRPRKRSLLAMAAVCAPVVTGVAATLAVNWARSGSPWFTGYAAYERPLNQSIPLTLNAAAALLASPRYGLLFFATPILLGLAGFAAFRRRHPLEAWGIIALSGAILLLYATYPTWYAGWTWGPRFLVPIVPFLMLPAAELFSLEIPSPRIILWTRLALLAGLAEQLLGVLVNYRAAYDVLPWAHPLTAHVWEPWTSPLLSHLLLLPLSLITNFGVRLPGTGVAAALVNYALDRLTQFFPFFWFSQFQQPVLALLVGGACICVPLVAAGRWLRRALYGMWLLPARSARILSD